MRTLLVAGLITVLCAVCAVAQPAALVKDINMLREDFAEPLFTSSGFLALGTDVFFVHNDGIHGYELWKTDGSEAGTVPVDDLFPGLTSSGGRIEGVLGDRLVFSATDGATGAEPWISDDTQAGTFLLRDLYPGPRSSDIGGAVVAGNRLYFEADDGVTGFEPWKVSRAALLTTFTDVPPDHWAWSFIEALAAEGVTTGCAPGQFCPDSSVSRDQMAAFLARTFGLL